MHETQIIDQLEKNAVTFRNLLSDLPEDHYRWKPQPEKWCLLEVVCHLYDEELEDFRTRVRCTMEQPHLPPPPIDPEAWVHERKYLEKDYSTMLEKLLDERQQSIQWLRNLVDPQWDNSYVHPTVGKRSARFYLANWLAHDYLHIRQIMKLKVQYWQARSGENLSYAGNL